jgi:hypothetical protein
VLLQRCANRRWRLRTRSHKVLPSSAGPQSHHGSSANAATHHPPALGAVTHPPSGSAATPSLTAESVPRTLPPLHDRGTGSRSGSWLRHPPSPSPSSASAVAVASSGLGSAVESVFLHLPRPKRWHFFISYYQVPYPGMLVLLVAIRGSSQAGCV